jgi:hypothetical protein
VEGAFVSEGVTIHENGHSSRDWNVLLLTLNVWTREIERE